VNDAEHLPTAHILSHVRDTLATDERVGELGLDVHAEPGEGTVEVVVVRGAVSTEARKAGVVPLVTEVLRAHDHDCPVRDETHVPAAGVPDHEAEAL
jgi:hypothetical protein